MKILHIIDDSRVGSEGEYMVRAALAVLRLPSAKVAAIAPSKGGIVSELQRHGIDVTTIKFGGLLGFIAVSRLANRIISFAGEGDGERDVIVHLHSAALLNVVSGAVVIAAKSCRCVKLVLSCGHADATSSSPAMRYVDAIVDPSVMQPATVCPKLTPAPEATPLRLFYAGRLDGAVPFAELIDALTLLGDKSEGITLTVVGEGEGRYVMPMIRKLRKAGIDRIVDWRGGIDCGDPSLAGFDVAVSDMPLSPSGEPSPLGCRHMASSMVLLAPGDGGDDLSRGILTWPSGNAASLASVISRLLADSDLVARLRRNAAATAEALWGDPDRFAARLGEFYKSLIETR